MSGDQLAGTDPVADAGRQPPEKLNDEQGPRGSLMFGGKGQKSAFNVAWAITASIVFILGLITASGSLGVVLGMDYYNTSPGDIPPAFAEFGWSVGVIFLGLWLEWMRRGLLIPMQVPQ